MSFLFRAVCWALPALPSRSFVRRAQEIRLFASSRDSPGPVGPGWAWLRAAAPTLPSCLSICPPVRPAGAPAYLAGEEGALSTSSQPSHPGAARAVTPRLAFLTQSPPEAQPPHLRQLLTGALVALLPSTSWTGPSFMTRASWFPMAAKPFLGFMLVSTISHVHLPASEVAPSHTAAQYGGRKRHFLLSPPRGDKHWPSDSTHNSIFMGNDHDTQHRSGVLTKLLFRAVFWIEIYNMTYCEFYF